MISDALRRNNEVEPGPWRAVKVFWTLFRACLWRRLNIKGENAYGLIIDRMKST